MRVTTRNFDDRARSYLAAKTRKESGEQEMKDLKPAFIAFLRSHGDLTRTGKKSLEFASELYDAMASFGQTTVTDPDAIEAFRQAFNVRGRKVSFSDLFEARTTYIVMPTALSSIQQLPKKLQRLYARIQHPEPIAPSLKIKRADVAEDSPRQRSRPGRELEAAAL